MDKTKWKTVKGLEVDTLGQETVAQKIMEAEGKKNTDANLKAMLKRIQPMKEAR